MSAAADRGVVAAGHPLTAQAGAQVLREGGNAVDAAVAAMLTSFAAEPLLTGLGAGGYMLVAGPEQEPVLLDFFVQAPTRASDGSAAELEAVDVSFGDAVQVFYIGPASCGIYGAPAGVCEAMKRWGTIELSELAAPAARLAREGVPLNAGQAYIVEILGELLRSTPECAALWAPDGRLLREGELLANPELSDALERLGRDGATPFYEGDVAAAVCAWLQQRGGSLAPAELACYRAIAREPLRAFYRDRIVLTNPPPSAGGSLIAYALGLLDAEPSPPSLQALVGVMEAAQRERTPEFVQGLSQEGFLERFLSSRLGSTTHISVLDGDGVACAVTCTNGEGSGVVVPGTGIHLNNVMGEEDLSPLGFHTHPAGGRMPSMMAPTVVMLPDRRSSRVPRTACGSPAGGEVELVLGSAGSNRIRSAILQTIVGVVDRDLPVAEAVCAPRVHFESGIVYHEPGLELPAGERELVRFHDLNLFFGGVQAVQRRGGELYGAGDPRRGGVAVSA
ncbi:MAG TPA: gamma-glutamyltransferase [Solirubrobacteraceae bacterium]|nr:gamma-glutamyltransferase [Solirubrobacteraceae bacterium]